MIASEFSRFLQAWGAVPYHRRGWIANAYLTARYNNIEIEAPGVFFQDVEDEVDELVKYCVRVLNQVSSDELVHAAMKRWDEALGRETYLGIQRVVDVIMNEGDEINMEMENVLRGMSHEMRQTFVSRGQSAIARQDMIPYNMNDGELARVSQLYNRLYQLRIEFMVWYLLA